MWRVSQLHWYFSTLQVRRFKSSKSKFIQDHFFFFYLRPRRLRQIEATFLCQFERFPGLLFDRLKDVLWKCPWQVGPRITKTRTKCPDITSWNPIRPSSSYPIHIHNIHNIQFGKRRGSQKAGQSHQSCRGFGMFCKEPGWC